MEKTQTPVDVADETQSAVSDASNVAESQDLDLDKILAEFEPKTVQAEPPKQTEQPKAGRKYSDEQIDAILSELESRETQSALGKAASVVGEGLNVSQDIIEGYIEVQARKDPRIAQAWMASRRNPDAWEKVLRGLNQKLVKELKGPDSSEGDSVRKKVVSAVKSASSKRPQVQDQASFVKKVQNMTDAELNAALRG